MGVIVPVGESQAVMRWSLAGDSEFMVCVLGLRDNLISNDPPAIAARFWTAWVQNSLAQGPQMGVGWSRGTAFVTTRLSSGPVTVEVGTAISNTGTFTTVPNNCAVLVRKQTAAGGRRNRGRMYLPPFMLPEGDVTPTGVIVANEQGEITAAMIQFRADLLEEDLTPVVQHDDGSPGTPITTFACQGRMATQRTRMRR